LDEKLAMYFRKIESSKVHCCLCPHNCVIEPGGIGTCKARKNINGELYSINYGQVASVSLDPIEKKPLYRFHPGSSILSVGTFGCNLKCSFCQNWNIAHGSPELSEISPSRLVEIAENYKAKGNIGIAYTYNEPAIWYEYVYESSRLAKEKGLYNVMVTNGFISEKPLKNLLPFIDAMNIDVKAYTSSFYNNICKGTLESVKKTVEECAQRCHVEVTTLVIPGLNDSLDEIEEMSRWLSSLRSDIPLHLSRFFPNYKMQDLPPTPEKTLINARNRALKHLEYVYIGNV